MKTNTGTYLFNKIIYLFTGINTAHLNFSMLKFTVHILKLQVNTTTQKSMHTLCTISEQLLQAKV